MITLLLTASSFLVLGLFVLAVGIMTAPEGEENDNGFQVVEIKA